MNFDADKGIYRDCRFCGGRGCLACPGEADRAYKAEFPNGPEPIFSIPREEVDHLEVSEMTGGPGIAEAHGPVGRFVTIIDELLSETRP